MSPCRRLMKRRRSGAGGCVKRIAVRRSRFRKKAEIAPALARILAARGVTCEDAHEAFLNPSLRNAMPDPYVLQDMEAAATRIANAIINEERVGVFGDYDVDGTSAAANPETVFRNALAHRWKSICRTG